MHPVRCLYPHPSRPAREQGPWLGEAGAEVLAAAATAATPATDADLATDAATAPESVETKPPS